MKLSKMNKMLACLSMLAASTTSWGFSSDWELVFNDEFSAASFNGNKLDWSDGNWNKISYVNWGVSDWRKYQSRDDSLVTKGQSNGVDYVTLKGSYGNYTSQNDQSGANDTFACGGIFTDQTFSFQYGYVEVRARFESAQGVWPAIWLMPKSGGWPDAGEIDMMEHLNFQNQIWQTLHLTGNSGSGDAAPSVQTQISDVNGWHTYGMEWTADSISFYIDGNWTATFNSSDFTYWPFDDGREFYLLIDQQIGGSWPGDANANTLKNNSADFDIDFVRVYSTEKNSPSAAVCPSWGTNGPVEKNGATIQYTEVSGVHNGALEQATAGNYSYSINGTLGRILAEDSNIRIAAQNGGDSHNWVGDMVQCRSLHIADGKFSLQGNSTFDVDTLYVVGGSLEVGAANALNSVEHLYLGMEADAITQSAQRNAALYITSNQHIKADVTLVDDSKIAVAHGRTLKISGDIHAADHTLNMVGVTNEGAGIVEICGKDNHLGRLSLGVAETTPNGNTFNGAGQILQVNLAQGSQTTVGDLVTNTPSSVAASSLTIAGGAQLTVTKEWKNASSANAYNVHIAQDGVLSIGDGTQAAKAVNLAGVRITNNGTLHVQSGAEMAVDAITVNCAANDSGHRAVLKVDGSLTASEVFVDANSWHSIGTLDVLNGDNVHISTLRTGANGQVDVNVRGGHLSLQSLNLGNVHPVVLQAESHAVGTVSVQNAVHNTQSIHVRAGRVEFNGGLSGGGTLEIKNNAVVSVKSSAGSQHINLEKNAVLETAGNYSGGTVNGSGTIRKTDAGTATVQVAGEFNGAVRADAGTLEVRGSASYSELAARGGDVVLSGADQGVTTTALSVAGDGNVSAQKSDSSAAKLTVASGGTVQADGGSVSADLILNDHVTLSILHEDGLVVNGSLSFKGLIALTADSLQTKAEDAALTLAVIRGDFTVNGQVWQVGESASADSLFTMAGVDLSDYTVHYIVPSTYAVNAPAYLVLTHNSIPEPTTATLSLLALAGLAARRRRK